jgi:lipocalin-like protein
LANHSTKLQTLSARRPNFDAGGKINVSNYFILGVSMSLTASDAFGSDATGFLTYTADGRMMAIVSFGGRKPLSVPDYISAPAAERAKAFATFFAYAGRYTFAGDRVTHHIEVAWMQNYVNTDQVRFILKRQDNRMTLRTPPFLKGGVQLAKQELVWERLNPETGGRKTNR